MLVFFKKSKGCRGKFKIEKFKSCGLRLLLLIAIFLAAFGATEQQSTDSGKPPNVLIISLDAARADHVGFYGYPLPTTPEIDQICKGSIVFDKAFAVAPFTLASVASLFTSLYPDTHAVLDEGKRLADTVPTLAESFKKKGYRTFLLASNPFLTSNRGLGRGFDVYEPEIGYGSDRGEKLARRAMVELEKASEPFLGYVHFLRPHEPYDAEDIRAICHRTGEPLNQRIADEIWGNHQLPSSESKRALLAGYDSGLRNADQNIGNLYQFLLQKRILDRTILIILSDHGEAFGEHGQFGHNSDVHREMIQIPLILYYPKILRPQKKHSLAQTVDIFPTVAELTGVPLPKMIQGQSLLCRPRTYAFSRTAGLDPIFAVRDSHFMMLRNTNFESWYDLQEDPFEMRGVRRDRVTGRKAAQLSELETVFARWLGFCLANNQGAKTVAHLDSELLARLKSLGYVH